MLTVEERMHMYRGKKLFIDHISKVFEDEYLQSNVARVDYEVYSKVIDPETTYYTEFVVVTFTCSKILQRLRRLFQAADLFRRSGAGKHRRLCPHEAQQGL